MNINVQFCGNGKPIQEIMEDIINNYLIIDKTCTLVETELECTNKM